MPLPQVINPQQPKEEPKPEPIDPEKYKKAQEKWQKFREGIEKKSGIYILQTMGSKVKIAQEKYQCPELLFQPQFFQRDHYGLHEQTFKSIKRCDDDIEKDLFQNVILCGGSSLFLKIRKKFEKELQSLAPTGKTVKVIAPPERKFYTWVKNGIIL